jgi:hypothetical protein
VTGRRERTLLPLSSRRNEMEIEVNEKRTVKPRYLKIHLKVSDRFSATLYDDLGTEIRYQEDGYVPGFMPGKHHGDYVFLDVDLESGKIVNWPSQEELEEKIQNWVNGEG